MLCVSFRKQRTCGVRPRNNGSILEWGGILCTGFSRLLSIQFELDAWPVRGKGGIERINNKPIGLCGIHNSSEPDLSSIVRYSVYWYLTSFQPVAV